MEGPSGEEPIFPRPYNCDKCSVTRPVVVESGRRTQRRFVFLCHSKELGGAELYLERLIRYLRVAFEQRVWEPACLEMVCRRDPNLDPWCVRIAAEGVEVHRLNLRSPLDYWRLWRVLRGATLVHLNFAFPFGKYQALGAIMARLGARRLIGVHQLVVDPNEVAYGPLAKAFWSSAFRFYGRLCHQNIVVSSAGQQLLVLRYGFDPKRLCQIYNGADLSVFRPRDRDEKTELKRRIGREVIGEDWSEQVPLLCSVGRLNRQKGFEYLVDATAAVVSRHPSLRCVLIGDGELRAELQALIARRGLEGHFFLAGRRTMLEYADWLAASDIFVLPSRFEGFPFVVVEAMASGCPVVATSISGVTDAVVENETGHLVPPGESAPLAKAIVDLLDRPTVRQAMGERGLERARRLFDLGAGLHQTAKLYERVIQRVTV